MSDELLIAGELIVPGDRSVSLTHGWLKIVGGTIAEMGGGDAPSTPDLGGDGYLISPGFIDAHCHLPQFDSIGVDGLTLLDWLDRVIFPAETRWEDADYAGAMTQRVCEQFASFGTTGIAAYATVHHEAAKVAIDTIASWGFRAMVGQVLMDRNAIPELLRPAKQLLTEAAALSELKPRGGRVEVSVNPRFAISCTEELLKGAGELAKRTNAPIQTHLSEMIPEVEFIGELFGGASYTEVYDRTGLLTPRSFMAHGVHLSKSELALLRKRDAVVAHCPVANDFLMSGMMDRQERGAASVRMSLGSDVAGGVDRSMVRVARAMLETSKRMGHGAIGARECWWQMTAGNADVLGWPETGRLVPGADADVVVFKPDIPVDGDDERRVARVLYAWDDRWLRATVAGGRVVYEV